MTGSFLPLLLENTWPLNLPHRPGRLEELDPDLMEEEEREDQS